MLHHIYKSTALYIKHLVLLELLRTQNVRHWHTCRHSGINQEPSLDFGTEKIYLFKLGVKETVPSLVILSACLTVDGFVADDEVININFSRGCNAIGTITTVANLWNANDNAFAKITSLFYNKLGAGKSTTEALRSAKLT